MNKLYHLAMIPRGLGYYISMENVYIIKTECQINQKNIKLKEDMEENKDLFI